MTMPKRDPNESSVEKLINSRKRVRKHGEVFTPSHIVRKMLDLPGINEACQDLTKTFFEPGAGEGAFLKRKLGMVDKQYSDTLARYENYSLLALSTLYGVELLDDNTRFCSMALYEIYYDAYREQLNKYNCKPKPSVINSARLIIAKNIVQGDFLTKLTTSGTPVVLSEWEAINLKRKPTALRVQRTEYTLDEIEKGITKAPGTVVNPNEQKGQMAFSFTNVGEQELQEEPELRYLPCRITSVHGEEQEQVDG